MHGKNEDSENLQAVKKMTSEAIGNWSSYEV
jgi:hypothetical protein